ncbi:ferritin-like domain-containing protein [Polyangium jinanense]|uniref:ferritin-like domain-containing protein n=1 Tax=Polyangium jinanense TaxID=2829994 RepID=UPI0023400D5A|nr:ferritin-like domain-containing protein [Polyangium jinanense]MDC3961662.1 ferritin-like domain-containing protein [Polyangium jinanense]
MTHAKHPSPLSVALFTRILRAAGLTAGATLAVAAAACGGNVVIDAGTGETGGTGGTGATGGSGGGTGGVLGSAVSVVSTSVGVGGTGAGGSLPCENPPPPDAEYRLLCLEGSVGGNCPPLADVQAELMKQVHGTDECVGSGTCCYDLPGLGCQELAISAQCCYYVPIVFESCEGRPFVVDGEARTADPEARADWLLQSGQGLAEPPNLSNLDPATRRALADHFTRSGLYEHASIASFARFVLELLGAGAPASLVSAAQEALADEVRHAKLCFGLASAYAGAPVGPGTLPMPEVSIRRTLADIALATVLEGAVNETLSALVAGEEALRATDPAVKATLVWIAEDEATHAELAWRTLAWALEAGGPEVARALEKAFSVAVCPEPEDLAAPGADPDKLADHGCLSAAEKRDVMRRAMADVILPAARTLLRAPRARRSVRDDAHELDNLA